MKQFAKIWNNLYHKSIIDMAIMVVLIIATVAALFNILPLFLVAGGIVLVEIILNCIVSIENKRERERMEIVCEQQHEKSMRALAKRIEEACRKANLNTQETPNTKMVDGIFFERSKENNEYKYAYIGVSASSNLNYEEENTWKKA